MASGYDDALHPISGLAGGAGPPASLSGTHPDRSLEVSSNAYIDSSSSGSEPDGDVGGEEGDGDDEVKGYVVDSGYVDDGDDNVAGRGEVNSGYSEPPTSLRGSTPTRTGVLSLPTSAGVTGPTSGTLNRPTSKQQDMSHQNVRDWNEQFQKLLVETKLAVDTNALHSSSDGGGAGGGGEVSFGGQDQSASKNYAGKVKDGDMLDMVAWEAYAMNSVASAALGEVGAADDEDNLAFKSLDSSLHQSAQVDLDHDSDEEDNNDDDLDDNGRESLAASSRSPLQPLDGPALDSSRGRQPVESSKPRDSSPLLTDFLAPQIAPETSNEVRAKDAGAFQRLSRLAEDFLFVAKLYGKVIISEVGLAAKDKSIKPVLVGGVAGGDKFIVSNILFKFARDTHGLYRRSGSSSGGLSTPPPPRSEPTGLNSRGSLSTRSSASVLLSPEEGESNAQNAAGHELKGMMAYFSTGVPGLSFPLIAIIDYCGYRVVAVSILPISKETLRYGSDDGGATVFADPSISASMRDAGVLLNIQPHAVGRRAGSEKILYAAGDVEGHIGRDGRAYVLDFARTLPPEYVGESNSLHMLLRPEFVASNQVPLSPDAFMGWSKSDPNCEVHQLALIAASVRLHKETIPATAGALLAWWDIRLATLDSTRVLDVIVDHVHSKGVNLRHLGRVWRHINDTVGPPTDENMPQRILCELFVVEMIARVLKIEFRTRLRSAKLEETQDANTGRTPSAVALKGASVDFLNSFLHSDTEQWASNIEKALHAKFFGEGFQDVSELRDVSKNEILAARASHIKLIIFRIQELTGLVLRFDPRDTLLEDIVDGSVTSIGFSDIKKVGVTCKFGNIIEYASGMAVAHLARSCATDDLKLREKLFRLADRHFSTAISRNPSSAFARHEYAMMLLERAKLLVGTLSDHSSLCDGDAARLHLLTQYAIEQLQACCMLWHLHPRLRAGAQGKLLFALLQYWSWTTRSPNAESDERLKNCLEIMTETLLLALNQLRRERADPASTVAALPQALQITLRSTTQFLLRFVAVLSSPAGVIHHELHASALCLCVQTAGKLELLGAEVLGENYCFVAACSLAAHIALIVTAVDPQILRKQLDNARALQKGASGRQHTEIALSLIGKSHDRMAAFVSASDTGDLPSSLQLDRFRRLFLDHSQLTAEIVCSILPKMKRLKLLQCRRNYALNFRSKSDLTGEVDSTIREADFSGCTNLKFVPGDGKKGFRLNFSALKRLSLVQCDSIDHDSISALSSSAATLQTLDISECGCLTTFDLSGFNRLRVLIARLCPELKGFMLGANKKLSKCDVFGCIALADKNVVENFGVEGRDRKLAFLDLGQCALVSDETVSKVIRANSLRTLKLEGLSIGQMTLKCLESNSGGFWGGISAKNLLSERGSSRSSASEHALECLTIDRCPDNFLAALQKAMMGTQSALETVQELSLVGQGGPCSLPLWPNLRLLDVSECHSADILTTERPSSGSGVLKRKAPRPQGEALELGIQTLRVQRCMEINSSLLVGVLGQITSLTSLEMGSSVTVNDDIIAIAAQNNKKLRKLDLFGCYGITNRSLQAVADNCSDLRTLLVGGCRNLSDAGLCAILESCRDLETLDVAATMVGGFIFTKFLRSLTSSSESRRPCLALKRLHFSRTKHMTDEGVRLLIEACPNVIECYLFMVKPVSDSTVKLGLETWTNLESLDLSGCPALTDEAFVGAARFPTNLRSVNLLGNRSVTDSTLRRLATSCGSHLEVVNVRGCASLSLMGLHSFVRHCSGLRSINVKEVIGDGWGTGQAGLLDIAARYNPLLKIIDA